MPPPVLGILMLETRFPRPPGDVGNPATWPFPVRMATVPSATADRIVRAGTPDPALLDPFVAVAHGLIAAGAGCLTTSCGFLAPYQAALTARLPVPVLTSALMQVPWVAATLPAGRRVGVVTVDAGRLGPAHLAAAGAPADTPVAGVEGGRELHRVLLGDGTALDTAAAAEDMRDAVARLLDRHPDVGAVVLECTNMPPYAPMLRRTFGLPVHDVVTAVRWLVAGVVGEAAENP
ncbi:MAG: aspartate/glutamate racemase family protein [Rhodospirillales bacterium]